MRCRQPSLSPGLKSFPLPTLRRRAVPEVPVVSRELLIVFDDPLRQPTVPLPMVPDFPIQTGAHVLRSRLQKRLLGVVPVDLEKCWKVVDLLEEAAMMLPLLAVMTVVVSGGHDSD